MQLTTTIHTKAKVILPTYGLNMVGQITMALAISLLSGQLRSTSLPLVASTVISGVLATAATSGPQLRVMAAVLTAPASAWMTAPARRTTAPGATVVLSVVYSASILDCPIG